MLLYKPCVIYQGPQNTTFWSFLNQKSKIWFHIEMIDGAITLEQKVFHLNWRVESSIYTCYSFHKTFIWVSLKYALYYLSSSKAHHGSRIIVGVATWGLWLPGSAGGWTHNIPILRLVLWPLGHGNTYNAFLDLNVV